jgi:excisionase family DNA binding protein
VPKQNAIAKRGYDVVSHSSEGVAQVGELLTVGEVAALLRCSISSLNKWRVSGRGPRFVRVGSRVRYRMRDLAAYITAQTHASTSEISD